MAKAGFAGRCRKWVPELLNSSGTGFADSTADNNVGAEQQLGIIIAQKLVKEKEV